MDNHGHAEDTLSSEDTLPLYRNQTVMSEAALCCIRSFLVLQEEEEEEGRSEVSCCKRAGE